MIRSAILLAAGRGKRQRPYTDRTPKPLLPVHGRPTLDYVLTAVKRAGVERVCIVTHHLEEQIFDYVGDGSRWNLHAAFAHQNELHGNGDALLSVPRDWIPDEPIMVAATDYILEENTLLALVEAHQKREADITVSLEVCPLDELSSRSSVNIDADWRVKKIIEKPKVEEILSPYGFHPVYLPASALGLSAQGGTSLRGEIELQSAVQRMIEDGYRVYGILQAAPEEWDPVRHLNLERDA